MLYLSVNIFLKNYLYEASTQERQESVDIDDFFLFNQA